MSSNLLEFLTSKEILIVYLLAAVAMLVCFIIYLVERNNEKLKQKHNTRELNKLVEQIKEEVYIYDEEEIEYEKPILETIEYGADEVGSVEDLVRQTYEAQKNNVETVEMVAVEENDSISQLEATLESVFASNEIIPEEVIEVESLADLDSNESLYVPETFYETVSESIYENTLENEYQNVDILKEVDQLLEETEKMVEEVVPAEKVQVVNDEELEYTDIELDQVTAKLELKKIEEELRRQEALEDTLNIALTNYEEQQEEAAIISLDELLKKGKEMYERNEMTQYEDEGNEPISLQDLERQICEKVEEYNEPFVIESVVPDNAEKVEIEELIFEEELVEVKPVVKETKFKASPVISPIYGIEKPSVTELELENTANYEKLDEEIKKTNDFLATLKDLQTKLDNNN